jgi:sortase A
MKHLARVFIYFGIGAVGLGFLILLATYSPIIYNEISYDLFHPKTPVEVALKQSTHPQGFVMTPVDANFGIVIPKIRANAKVIPNVDPYNSSIYQVALTKGVAHAKGTFFPGEGKNIFLFSHSSANFYDALRYNSIFYLLSKLEKNDSVYLFYKNKKYTYSVISKKLVDPTDTSYLTQQTNTEILTLMTCWPPGTSFKRLLVFAHLQSVN